MFKVPTNLLFSDLNNARIFQCMCVEPCSSASSLAKGYDPLYSSSPLASLDGFA